MDSVVEKFTNNTYKILKKIYDCQMKLPDGNMYLPISQAELSRIMGVTTVTMYRYFKDFQADGLIEPFKNRKYRLSDKALKIIDDIENLKKEIDGGNEK